MHYRKALSFFEALSAADPTNALASRSVAISYEKLGDALLQTGDANEALNIHRKSLAIRETLFAADPASVPLRRDMAKAYFDMGADYAALAKKDTQRLRQAVTAYEKSLDLWVDLSNRGLLKGDDLQQPDKVKAELEKTRGLAGK
jgi:tetratricopeptide (TPR) repeat protein